MPKKRRYGMTAKAYRETRLGQLGNHDFESDTPKSLPVAAGILRTRGYGATTDKVNQLVLKGIIEPSDLPARRPSWTPERIEQAAAHFEANEDYSSEAEFYIGFDLTMDDVYQALKDAFDAAIDEFGSAAFAVLTTRPDRDQFTMTVIPPYGKQKAGVVFALHPEVRKAIQKKNK